MTQRRYKFYSAPYYSGNPYQSLLYSEFPKNAVKYCDRPKQLRRLMAEDNIDILHLHWDEAFEQGRWKIVFDDGPIRPISDFVERGGRVVWTLHNEVPHRFEAADAFFATRRSLAKLAHLVHVHSDAARQHARQLGVPEANCQVIEHPSYVTLYPKPSHLSGRDGPKRLLFFGAIRQQKNLHSLFEALSDRGDANDISELTIAGRNETNLAMTQPKGFPPGIMLRVIDEFIPEADVPRLFAGADFMVAPFARGLTSGSIVLSLGFGVPVIAPKIGGFSEVIPEVAEPLLYDADDPNGLRAALARAAALTANEHSQLREACYSQALKLHPKAISTRLMDCMHSLSPLRTST